jgi:hypothetical protein
MLLAKMSASLNFQWRGYCFIAYGTSKYVGEVNPELLNKPIIKECGYINLE